MHLTKEVENSGHFFKDDPRINVAGRPLGSKNKLTLVKDRVVSILNTRLDDFRKVAELDTPSLLRFVASVMPKDISLTMKPDLTYISSIPRNTIDKPKYKAAIDNEPSTTLAAMVDNGGNDSGMAATPPIIGKRATDKPLIIGKGIDITPPATPPNNGNVNDTIAIPQATPPDKVASTKSINKEKCGIGEGKKEVVSETIPPKISKIK